MFLRTGVVLVAATAAFEYDESAAALDIWVSQAMDCPGSQGADLTNWDCGLACSQAPLSDVHVLQNATIDTYGIAAIQGDECLLALRGTKNIENMISDVNILMKNPWGEDCTQCKVHDGFYNAWHSLAQQAHEALNAMGCNQKTLRVTGHSLGASMAAMAAYELGQWYDISAVYTYGQPRTGNSHWVTAFSERLVGVPYFRVTDYQDPIPQLIIHNMFFQGWEHQLPEVYYDSTNLGAYTVCTVERSTECSSQWNVVTTKDGGCFHCSYLGLNPCTCDSSEPECTHESESLV
jgi:hypothetical protein